MTFLLLNGLLPFSIVDIIDIVLVATIMYFIFKLIKGTSVMKIFIGIVSIYLVWKLVDLLNLRLLSEILEKVISVGVLALIIVFQPEIRRFLLILGDKIFNDRNKVQLFKRFHERKKTTSILTPIIQACSHMSQSKTGALIVFCRGSDLGEIIETGEKINSVISAGLLETIFFKNTPLHDGAVVISGNKIVSARCILPVSSNPDISANLGLRHRSAIGVTELSDAIAIVVSEQTGTISLIEGGEIQYDISNTELRQALEKGLSGENE